MIGRYFRVQIDGHLGMIQMRKCMDFPRTLQDEIRRPRQDENGKEQACDCRCSVKVTPTHSDRRPGFSSRLCFADFSRGIRDKEGGDASGIWRKGGRQHDRAEFFSC